MNTIPVFDEATQMAARFIESPICVLTLMVFDQMWIKSAIGLSRLGLMNRLATDRKLDRQETSFAASILSQDYGIRRYLGAPLITAGGQCIGSLSILDLTAQRFTNREIEFLCVTARWCMGEFERDSLPKKQSETIQEAYLIPKLPTPVPAIAQSTENAKERLLEKKILRDRWPT